MNNLMQWMDKNYFYRVPWTLASTLNILNILNILSVDCILFILPGSKKIDNIFHYDYLIKNHNEYMYILYW